jgi:hypothetical protein
VKISEQPMMRVPISIDPSEQLGGRSLSLSSTTTIAAIGIALPGNAFYAATKAEVAILTRACTHKSAMSALAPKADIVQHGGNVRFVPKADIPPFIRSPRRRGRARTAEL